MIVLVIGFNSTVIISILWLRTGLTHTHTHVIGGGFPAFIFNPSLTTFFRNSVVNFLDTNFYPEASSNPRTLQKACVSGPRDRG